MSTGSAVTGYVAIVAGRSADDGLTLAVGQELLDGGGRTPIFRADPATLGIDQDETSARKSLLES